MAGRNLRSPGRFVFSALSVSLWLIFLSSMLSCNSFSLNLLSHDKSEKTGADTHILPAPPGRYTFRIAPYVFLSDFEVQRDLPLFKELAKLSDQVYRELQLTPGHSAVQVYLFESKERYDQFMHA